MVSPCTSPRAGRHGETDSPRREPRRREGGSRTPSGAGQVVTLSAYGYIYCMPIGNPDPDPYSTPGLEPGGGVPPGETPPAEGSTSEAGPRNDLSKGWATGPMIAILALVVLVAAFFLAYAIYV